MEILFYISVFSTVWATFIFIFNSAVVIKNIHGNVTFELFAAAFSITSLVYLSRSL